jgi:hypothetical protein
VAKTKLQSGREWRARNPDYAKQNYRKNSARVANNTLKRKFGITLEEYDRRLEEQNFGCAICGQPETSTYKGTVRRLAVDHDHETGEIRGLLCGSCNSGIGLLKEDPEILLAAVDYLGGFRNNEYS